MEVVAGGNDEDGVCCLRTDLGEIIQPVFAGGPRFVSAAVVVLCLKGGRNLAASETDGIAALSLRVGGYGLGNHVVVFCKQYAHGVLLN